MSSNYEWNKQWVEQRLQSRYDDAAQHRRARQSSSAVEHQHRHGLSLRTWLVSVWHRVRPRQAAPTTPATAAQNDLS